MNIFKSTSIYILGTIIEKGLAFFLIPLYTHYLTTKDYGMMSILQSIINIGLVFFSLSLNGAASRFHFEGKTLYRKYHYGNIFASIFIINIIMTIVFLLIGKYIFNLAGNIPIYPYLYLIILIIILLNFYNIYQLKLQMEQNPKKFVLNNIAKFLLSTILTIYFIVYLKLNVVGVFLSIFIVLLFFDFYLFYRLKNENIYFNLNKRLLKRNIFYSIYLVPHNIAGIINGILDRFFIANMINLSNAGIYSLGFQLSSILGIFASSINKAFVPITLKAFKDKNYKYLSELANISIFSITIVATILSLFSKEIVDLISPESFSNASNVITLLSFYFVIQMYYYRTVGVLFYDTKATKYVPLATVLSLILNFGFNYFFIKLWGIEGAALATVLSMIIVNYIVIFIANRYILVGFEHFKIHFFIIIGFLVSNFCVEFNIIVKLLLLFFIIFIFAFIERKNTFLQEIYKRIKFAK